MMDDGWMLAAMDFEKFSIGFWIWIDLILAAGYCWLPLAAAGCC